MPQDAAQRQGILDELRVIAESPHFRNSKRYPSLLRYIVENTLAGRQEVLKERTIGIEVFGRSATYDTSADTVVRFTAGEVRKRLQLYYADEGKDARIRIALHPGSYVAEFSPEFEPTGQKFRAEEPEHRQEPDSAAPQSGESEPADVSTGVEASAIAPDGSRTASHSLRRWIGLAAVAVFIALLGAGMYFRLSHSEQMTSPLKQFWAPALNDTKGVILCSGSVIFRNGGYSGVTTAHKGSDYAFVSTQNVSSIARVQDALNGLGIKSRLAFSVDTPISDLREHTVVMLGGFNNDFTIRLLEPLRFHFVSQPEERIVDSQRAGVQWQRNTSLPYSAADDYAMVARFRDSTVDGWVFVLAGIGRNGTETAAQFASDPHYLGQLQQIAGKSFAGKNLQVILKVNVIEGKTGAPTIVAVHTW